MIQVKTFNQNVKDTELNKFLSEKRDAVIISFNPIRVQYNVEDDTEKAIWEIKGLPIDMRIVSNGNDCAIRCGLIIVFQSFLIFKLRGKTFIKIDLSTFIATDHNGKRIYGNKKANFLTFGREYEYGCRLDDHNWSQIFTELCEQEGMVINDTNYQYNKRTEVVDKVGRITAKAHISAARIQADATIKLAQATLIAGLAQADAQGKSERYKQRLENSHPFDV